MKEIAEYWKQVLLGAASGRDAGLASKHGEDVRMDILVEVPEKKNQKHEDQCHTLIERRRNTKLLGKSVRPARPMDMLLLSVQADSVSWPNGRTRRLGGLGKTAGSRRQLFIEGCELFGD